MPVFLTMTHGMTDKERQSIVQRATIVSFVTLMVFVFAGQFLFKFFGISTDGFRIAGGVIIFKIGFDMLQARYTPMKLKDEEIKTYADDISITPLGIPMLCGPGAIANAIVLMQDAHNFEMKGILIGTIGLIYLLTFFILRASTKLVSVLGETGNNVMMRLTVDDKYSWDFAMLGVGLRYINGVGKPDMLHYVESFGMEGHYDFASNRGYIWSRTFPLLKRALLLGVGQDNFAYAFQNDDYVDRKSVV